MFGTSSIIWTIGFWGLLFTYSYLSYIEAEPVFRTVPLALFVAGVLTFVAFIGHAGVVKYTKTILWVAAWSIAIVFGLLFSIFGSLNEMYLNIYLTTCSALASIAWCFVSHSDKRSEQGLHWYIWTLAVLITVSCGVDRTEWAVLANSLICGMLVLATVVYVVHICKTHAANEKRCRQLWRVLVCFALFSALVIINIVVGTSTRLWVQYVLVLEGVLLGAVVVDFAIGYTKCCTTGREYCRNNTHARSNGFSQTPIYKSLPIRDNGNI